MVGSNKIKAMVHGVYSSNKKRKKRRKRGKKLQVFDELHSVVGGVLRYVVTVGFVLNT
jgi:hypothetical protein